MYGKDLQQLYISTRDIRVGYSSVSLWYYIFLQQRRLVSKYLVSCFGIAKDLNIRIKDSYFILKLYCYICTVPSQSE